MRKFLVVVAMVLPFAASATCVWTTDDGLQSGKVVCSSTTETAIAGAAGTAVGWPAGACTKGMVFTACTDSGKLVSAALTLSVYRYSPWAALWGAWPARDMTSGTISAAQRCQTFDGIATVVGGGRVAVIPTAGTVDAGSVTVWWACN